MPLHNPFSFLTGLDNVMTTPLVTNYATQAKIALAQNAAPHSTQGVDTSINTQIFYNTTVFVALVAAVAQKSTSLLTTDADVALEPAASL